MTGPHQRLLPAPGPHVIGLRVHVGVLAVRDGRVERAKHPPRHAGGELVPLREIVPRVLRFVSKVRLRAGDGAPHFERGLPAPEARLRPRRAVPRAGLLGLMMMISLSSSTLYLLVIIALMVFCFLGARGDGVLSFCLLVSYRPLAGFACNCRDLPCVTPPWRLSTCRRRHNSHWHVA